ncbi:hypothetical protein [Priestia aryabhattai]
MKIIETTLYSLPENKRNAQIINADWNKEYGLLAVIKNGDEYEILLNKYAIYPGFEVDYPLARWIDEQRIILVNPINEENIHNAFVIDRSGNIQGSFNCGDCIKDVSPSDNGIWVSYYDEGVFGEGISTEGLVHLDLNGKPTFKFNSELRNKIEIDDCYAINGDVKNRLWLCPYPEFELVHMEGSKVDSTYNVPKKLYGSNAISIREGNAFFYSPYDAEDTVYIWSYKEEKEPIIIGELKSERVRGLRSRGKDLFIGIDSSNITLFKVESL